MEGLKEAIDRVAELAVQAEKTEVVTIAGKTYANRNLVRYDTPKKAAAICIKAALTIGTSTPLAIHDAVTAVNLKG